MVQPVIEIDQPRSVQGSTLLKGIGVQIIAAYIVHQNEVD